MNKTTADTSTSTTASQWTTYQPYTYNSEKGWECPRCGRINAPWVRQCDCSRNNWTVTWTSGHVDYKPEWWKEVTCGDSCPDNVMNNPVTYKVENMEIGGSDYYDDKNKQWINVVKGYTNSATSVDSPWNQYSTLTNQLDKLKYEIEELKETK